MEQEPDQAILTNIKGSKNMMDLAVKYNAETFVAISTDKAVHPTCVMGISKRIVEIYAQSLSAKLKKNNSQGYTRIIAARFGNVFGSSGSVVARFKNQIENKKTLTLTHPEVTRYFMSISEACSLVLEAGDIGQGGEIFIFDMGEQILIKYLAEKMIRHYGLEPYKDIDIQYTQLPSGEKLHEDLIYNHEVVKPTRNSKISMVINEDLSYNDIESSLSELFAVALTYDNQEIIKRMKRLATAIS